jgi:hypothetical protein
MRLTLTIDLDALSGDVAAEVGRILRYWGSNTKHLDWTQEAQHALTDSEYREVGTLRIAPGQP